MKMEEAYMGMMNKAKELQNTFTSPYVPFQPHVEMIVEEVMDTDTMEIVKRIRPVHKMTLDDIESEFMRNYQGKKNGLLEQITNTKVSNDQDLLKARLPEVRDSSEPSEATQSGIHRPKAWTRVQPRATARNRSWCPRATAGNKR